MPPEHLKPKFRLGLLLDTPRASKYVVEFVRRSQSHGEMEIPYLLYLPSEAIVPPARLLDISPQTRPRLRSYFSQLFFRLIIGIERLLLLKNQRHYDHLQKFDLFTLLPNAIVHNLRENNDVRTIEAPDLDLVVVLSTRLPPTGVINGARHGAIAVSHSNDFIYQDGPEGFWEVYFRCDVTEFSIERLTDTSAAREVLLRGRVGTQFYYLLNQAALLEKSSYYLFKIVEEVVTTGEITKIRAELARLAIFIETFQAYIRQLFIWPDWFA